MNTNVLRRFIMLMVVATFVGFTGWVFVEYLNPPPGDYETRAGDIKLSGGEFEAAIADFESALTISPNHRGALMGRAIAQLQLGRIDEAEASFSHLIRYMEDTLVADDDPTGVGVLASAYANRGILKDRNGRHAEALEDYKQSLRVDYGAVEGPGLVDKILHDPNPSTVVKRAQYLIDQFKLPEDQQRLSIPELDAEQRMHKP